LSKHWEEKCNGNNKPRVRCNCTNAQAVTVLGPTPAGPPGAGAIIPFASGTTPVVLTRTDVAGVVVNTGAIVGFGSSAPTADLSAGTLTLGTGVGTITDFAFVVPRAGTVTSISAFFSATAGTLAAAGTVRAELWISPAASNTFTPTGVFVDLVPDFGPGVVAPGTTASGTATPTLPVAAGDKLLLVFSLNPTTTPPGPTNIGALTGFASAGVGIS
jgi:BclB C-terminal domain-containing protein